LNENAEYSREFSSAHYFWFIIQTACHVYRFDIKSDSEKINRTLSNCLLLFLNSNLLAKRIYRLIITILTLSSMIYYFFIDIWSMFIIPAGEIPLILMWTLNISHLIGIFAFVIYSFCDGAREQFQKARADVFETDHLNNQTWKLIISIILIQVNTIFHLLISIFFYFLDYHSIYFSTSCSISSIQLVCIVYFLVNSFRSCMATHKNSISITIFMLLLYNIKTTRLFIGTTIETIDYI